MTRLTLPAQHRPRSASFKASQRTSAHRLHEERANALPHSTITDHPPNSDTLLLGVPLSEQVEEMPVIKEKIVKGQRIPLTSRASPIAQWRRGRGKVIAIRRPCWSPCEKSKMTWSTRLRFCRSCFSQLSFVCKKSDAKSSYAKLDCDHNSGTQFHNRISTFSTLGQFSKEN